MRNTCTVLSMVLIGISTGFAQADTTATDSLLLKQLKEQMAPPSQPQPSQSQTRSGASTNPNISAIGDFQGSYHSQISRNYDFFFNEGEFSFQSFVDPYARADFFLSLERNRESGRCEADIEEAYLTTIDLPAGLQLKAGKFRMSLGRINPVHPHALPFVDVPLAYANYFGEGGLNDEGLSISWLVPNPVDFYQELTFEVTDGPADNPSFTRSPADKYLYLAHLKNFWDLSQNSTLELGLSGVTGPNDSSYSTTIGAIDLTYKWKPLQFNTYQSFVWQSEAYFSRAKVAPDNDLNTFGMYSFITFQIEKRWFLTGRFDYSNLPYSAGVAERAYSATLGWYATEFQKIELEGKTTSSNVADSYQQAMLRWIFVIGSHGAHAY